MDKGSTLPGKVNYDDVPHFVNNKGKRIFCRYWNSKESDKPK